MKFGQSDTTHGVLSRLVSGWENEWVNRNNDERTRHARQTRRLLIMIVLLLGLLASAIARRTIEARRTEPPRLKTSSDPR
jgi:hypothetical protein